MKLVDICQQYRTQTNPLYKVYNKPQQQCGLSLPYLRDSENTFDINNASKHNYSFVSRTNIPLLTTATTRQWWMYI